MLPHTAPAPQPVPASARSCGVGLDTSRYGPYAAFLRDDLQPAAAELQFAESAKGYASFRQRLEQIVQRHGAVHFAIRLDAAAEPSASTWPTTSSNASTPPAPRKAT